MKIVWLGNEQKLTDAYLAGEHEFLIMNRDTFDMDRLKSFQPDIVIEREFNDGKSIYDMEWDLIEAEMPHVKRAIWFIDTHVAFGRHLAYAKHFTHIFFAISRFVPVFQRKFKDKKVFWLPLCFPLPTLPPMALKKKYKASFVGRWNAEWFPERTALVERLKTERGFFAITDYNNVYQIMSASDISFNRSIGEDMNYRVFEALGCGTELVTNDVDDLHKIEGLADQIHIYKEGQDGVQMVKDLMAGKKRYRGDRCSHRRWISENHLLYHRVGAIIKMVVNEIQVDY